MTHFCVSALQIWRQKPEWHGGCKIYLHWFDLCFLFIQEIVQVCSAKDEDANEVGSPTPTVDSNADFAATEMPSVHILKIYVYV